MTSILLYTIVKVAKKNKPRRGVSPKPMQKLLSAPDEAGLPVDSGLNGRSTEVYITTKQNKHTMILFLNLDERVLTQIAKILNVVLRKV